MPAVASHPLKCAETAEAALGTRRVDLAEGVIYGVKVAGFQSKNKGRTIGLSSRDFGDAVNKPYSYDRKAFESALSMYEGAGVYRDHPGFEYDADGGRKVKGEERSSDDLVGWLQNVRVLEDGVYADLHYLKEHPFSTRLVEVAERCPNKLALSHEAMADEPVVRNGRIVLTKILAVDGIAITAHKPGTTSGLFESHANYRGTMKIKELFAALPEGTQYRASVLEALEDPGMAPMGDVPVEAPAPDAAGAGGSPEDSVKAGFKAMIMSVLDDADMSVPDMRTKLMGLLDAFEVAQSAVGGGGGGDDKKDKGEKKKPPVAETQAKAQATILECVEMLTDAEQPTSRPILEAMALLPTAEARASFVAALPKAGKTAAAPVARSAAAPVPRRVAESQAKPDQKPADPYAAPGSFAQALRGG